MLVLVSKFIFYALANKIKNSTVNFENIVISVNTDTGKMRGTVKVYT